MSQDDLTALLPLVALAVTAIAVLSAIATRRSHTAAAAISVFGLLATLAVLPVAATVTPRRVTPLLTVDGFALFFTGLLCAASVVVALLSHGYFARRRGQQEELYLLLVLATMGSAVLASSTHFASLFLGLELLSVSLYALIAYPRGERGPLEAGLKYLILAAASSAFLLFGMALLYGVGGSLELPAVANLLSAELATRGDGLLMLSGMALVLVGVGFKLALVPFHLWTPDVYAGAPAPVTAFVATVSKGGMFALVLRFFDEAGAGSNVILLALSLIAIASMLVGNLLALLQDNLKRLLAYSSIAHLGYLVVTLLATGELAVEAATYYLVAYFVTTLAAFGILTVVSGEREHDTLEDYRGLFWRRPLLAAIFTTALLSLAGIPLTAGFVGKFYVLAAGVDSGLWLLVLVLVAGSVIGLFYYLRVVVALFSAGGETQGELRLSATAMITMASLLALLIWLGVYPAPLASLIRTMVAGI